MKYDFVRTHEAQFRVAALCRVLQVSRSGYYEWRTRPPSCGFRRSRAGIPADAGLVFRRMPGRWVETGKRTLVKLLVGVNGPWHGRLFLLPRFSVCASILP